MVNFELTVNSKKNLNVKIIYSVFQIDHRLLCVSNRSFTTKLRISSHNLHIETGRHKRPKKTPVENRYCTYCTGKNIEDEMHFVCDCELYKNIRTKFFEKNL